MLIKRAIIKIIALKVLKIRNLDINEYSYINLTHRIIQIRGKAETVK